MAPRTKGKGKGKAVIDYDNSRFGGPNQQNLFNTTWRHRNVLAERAIDLDDFSTQDFNLKQNMIDRGWVHFVTFSGNAAVPLVQEFFSNVIEHQTNERKIITSMVRKKLIKLTPTTVALSFDIPEMGIELPQYPMSVKDSPRKDELAKILTGKPDARWGSRSQLETCKLSRKYNTLFLLSIAKLKPLAHKNLVSYERAVLLYAIERSMTINLPSLVWTEISNAISNTNGTASLPFGSFLTTYFEQKGVKITGEMEIVRPIGPICERTAIKSTALLKKRKVDEEKDKQNQILMRMDEIEANQWTIIEQNNMILAHVQSQVPPPQPNMPPPPSSEDD